MSAAPPVTIYRPIVRRASTAVRPVNDGDSYRAYDSGGTKYVDVRHDGTDVVIVGSDGAVAFYKGLGSGNQDVSIYGWDSGAAAQKKGTLRVASTGAFQIDAQSGEDLTLMIGGTRAVNIRSDRNVGVGHDGAADVRIIVDTGVAGNRGLALRGASGQTANLLEALTDSDVVILSIDAAGTLTAPMVVLSDAMGLPSPVVPGSIVYYGDEFWGGLSR